MEYREDIEQLVKNTFDNFEADVHPDAWMNIQNGLNVAPAANPASIANNVSTGAKMAALSSKYIIMAVTVIIGITATVVYFSSDNETAKTNPANESKIVENTLPVVVSTNADTKNLSETGNVKKEEKPVSSDKTVSDKNEKQEPSRQSPTYYSSTNDEVVTTMSKKNAEIVLGEKNENAESKAQTNPVEALSVKDEKKADENNLTNAASDQKVDDVSDITPAEEKTEKSIEEYLGIIQNAFTPNGDGKNDAFVIEGKDIKTLKVSIYNRSGKIIHQWNNLHGFWDGKLQNGEPAAAGTYFYDIFAQTNSGKPLPKKGAFRLLLK